MMNDAATVFVVRDIGTAVGFYRDRLGFDVAFEYGAPTFYVGLCRDHVGLHLIAQGQTRRQPGQSLLCVFVDDVDALHAEFAGRGAPLAGLPEDRDYGMRDFNVSDPDGNELNFGAATRMAT